MLLRAYTRAKVGWGDFRIRLHDHLLDRVGSERGAVATEYALLIVLIALVIIVGAGFLGAAINDKLTEASDTVNTVPAP